MKNRVATNVTRNSVNALAKLLVIRDLNRNVHMYEFDEYISKLAEQINITEVRRFFIGNDIMTFKAQMTPDFFKDAQIISQLNGTDETIALKALAKLVKIMDQEQKFLDDLTDTPNNLLIDSPASYVVALSQQKVGRITQLIETLAEGVTQDELSSFIKSNSLGLKIVDAEVSPINQSAIKQMKFITKYGSRIIGLMSFLQLILLIICVIFPGYRDLLLMGLLIGTAYFASFLDVMSRYGFSITFNHC